MQKLAIIIPIYINDKLEYFIKAVDSILTQSYKDYTLFIAVDGIVKSTTNNYLNNLQKQGVKIIRYKENRGLAPTLNDSIKYVKNLGYGYIARMDADDISHEDRFLKQMQFFKNNKDVKVLGTQAYIIDPKDKIIGIKNAQFDISYKVLKKRSDIIHPSAIFVSSFFDTVGYYNENVARAEDYDLWFRAAKKSTIIKSIPERLYYFRYDEKIVKRRQEAQKQIIKVKKTNISYYEYLNLIPHYIVRFMPSSILKYILFKTIKEKER